MERQSEEQWFALWQRLGAQGDAAVVYEDLIVRYSEPHRTYHTLTHIANCLGELKRVQHLVTNQDAVEFAIWFHDAVYDPKVKDNEEKSSILARAEISDALLPESFGQLVADLIMATQHTIPPVELNAQLLVDIDLCILGQAAVVFDEYERQIREEYAWVEDAMFIAGRSTVLKSFLDHPSIYATQFFRNMYEVQARCNISRSLQQLTHRS